MSKISENRMRILAISFLSILLLLVLLWLTGFTETAGMAWAAVTPIISGAPATLTNVNEASPSLLQNEIDNRIVKIRPMSTPIDQISRYKGARKAGALFVDYYSVDMKPHKCKLAANYTEPTAEEVTEKNRTLKIVVDNIDTFEVSDTIFMPDVNGYDGATQIQNGEKLIFYVLAKYPEEDALLVTPVNGKTIGTVTNCVPTLYRNMTLVRMGRAATELDVQTAQFESIPTKEQNFCQIFKMQIEQSTYLKIANKEVEWDFSDQEEAAIYDMRLSMERSFLFGKKQTIYDQYKKENVYLTNGIWWQAGKQFDYTDTDEWNNSLLVDMMKECFTGNAGNKRKVLVAGSDLISDLSKIEMFKTSSADETMVKWGLDFNEIVSKFGKLYVIHSEIFDDMGMSKNGLVFDPEYIQKWSHVPFGSQTLDLKKAGIRNTDALVLTEASCLTLRYPQAHMRIAHNA